MVQVVLEVVFTPILGYKKGLRGAGHGVVGVGGGFTPIRGYKVCPRGVG